MLLHVTPQAQQDTRVVLEGLLAGRSLAKFSVHHTALGTEQNAGESHLLAV